MTMEGNTSPVNKISLNFNCMDLASSDNFQGDMGPASVAYPGWHTPGVQTEDGVLAPPGKLKNGAPRRRCWMGEGGSMLEVIISFSDNVIGIRLLKIALTLN